MRAAATYLLVFLMLTACRAHDDTRPQVPHGDAQRGRIILAELQCNVCHDIPGIGGTRGYVGPSLAAYSRNVYVAGKFPNTPEVLVHWIRDAPSLAPETAMPAFSSISEAQARDVAAYLYSLE
jgi:L-cysteine S-thiosulfotransferase